MGECRLKRIYEPAASSDGYRILVDRVWPRGVSKEEAKLDLWLKEVGPSTELRKWFGHEPERYPEFRDRYRRELEANPAFEQLRREVAEHGTTTLLYGARDEERNQAVVLRELLD